MTRLPKALTIYWFFALVLMLQIPAGPLIAQGHYWQGILYSQCIAIALPTTLFVHFRRYDWRTLFPLHSPTILPLLIVVAITIVVTILTDIGVEWSQRIFDTAPPFEERIPELLQISSVPQAIVKILLLAVAPALVEEGFFRGFCQTSLMREHGQLIGCVAAAALFAAAHSSVAYFHLYFLLGLFLGYLRIRSGALWWPLTAHFANNVWTIFQKGLS